MKELNCLSTKWIRAGCAVWLALVAGLASTGAAGVFLEENFDSPPSPMVGWENNVTVLQRDFVDGVGVGGSRAMQMVGYFTNSSAWFAMMYINTNIAGNSDATLANTKISFDIKTDPPGAAISLGLQSWPGNNYGGSMGFSVGSILLPPAPAGQFQTVTLSLSDPALGLPSWDSSVTTLFDPAGGIFQVYFQAEAAPFDGPYSQATVTVDNLRFWTADPGFVTVTTLNDGDSGSLREALANAVDGDAINFAVSGMIQLTGGELLVDKNVSIFGSGCILDAAGSGRILHIAPGRTVRISGLTLMNGSVTGTMEDSGGAIWIDHATLTVDNCQLFNNWVQWDGGAIYNDGRYTGGTASLCVGNCGLNSNSGNGGAAIKNDGASTGNAALTVFNSYLWGNYCGPAGGGGIWNDGYQGNASLRLIGGGIGFNTSSGTGAGINNDGYNGQATLQIRDSIINGNNTFFYDGAGIFNNGAAEGNATVTVVRSDVSGNTSGSGGGGGIKNDGTGNGNAVAVVVASTLSYNQANGFHGGGIWNDGYTGNATLQLANCTISGNWSATQGGGVANDGYSGNVHLQIFNSTFSDNSAANSGGNLFNGGEAEGAAALEIGSTILNNGWPENLFNASGAVTSDGYNLSSDAAGATLTSPTDQPDTKPWLGPLAYNGGPTMTHELLACSPAIDRGKNFIASMNDQRGDGFARLFDYPGVLAAEGGDGTDIGAFEVQAELVDITPPTIIPTDQVVNATSPAGAEVTFAPTVLDNCGGVTVTCTPPSGSTFAVGFSMVYCQACDGAGNCSFSSFTVYVKGAAEQISDLIALVQGLPISPGIMNSLVVKLRDASVLLAKGNTSGACGKMKDFISEVRAQAAKKQLTAAQADQLVRDASRVRAVLGC